jgi:hypothetical protein
MNKDQKLIFEAYTETLTEDWQKGTSKAPKGKSFDMSRGGAPSNVDAARDGSGGRYRKTRPPSAQSNKTHGEMEEENNLDNTPLEELHILTPIEYELVRNFENFNSDEWGYNSLQKFYFRKREGGEEDENDQYEPEEAPEDDQLGEIEPLNAEEEENDLSGIEMSLERIADELKTLNQYADFMTTGTRGKGFTAGVAK